MKRLRDLEAPTPLLAKAQLLIGSLNALPESPERMWRIRRELDRPHQAVTFSALRRLPAVAVAGAVVLFGASAFAAVRLFAGGNSHGAEVEVEPQPAAARPTNRITVLPQPTPTVEAAAPAVPPAELASAEPAPVTAPTIGPVITWRHHHGSARSRIRAHARARADHKRATRHARGLRARTQQAAISAPMPTLIPTPARDHDLELAADEPQQAAESPEVAAVPQQPQPQAPAPTTVQREVRAATHEATARSVPATDSELVHRATKALRHDHDPVLAARLLAQQRERDPGGPLAQEALALQVEAAVQSHDARARSFAREYLAHYPNGRYRSVAEHALSEPAP